MDRYPGRIRVLMMHASSSLYHLLLIFYLFTSWIVHFEEEKRGGEDFVAERSV